MKRSSNIRYTNAWIDFQGDGRFPTERIKGKDKRYLGKWSRNKIAKEIENSFEEQIMTVKDLIKNKDYDYISWRVTTPPEWGEPDMFFGACKSVNGELIPLDGDNYYEDEVVVGYEEWSDDEIKNGLTVVIEAEWI